MSKSKTELNDDDGHKQVLQSNIARGSVKTFTSTITLTEILRRKISIILSKLYFALIGSNNRKNVSQVSKQNLKGLSERVRWNEKLHQIVNQKS